MYIPHWLDRYLTLEYTGYTNISVTGQISMTAEHIYHVKTLLLQSTLAVYISPNVQQTHGPYEYPLVAEHLAIKIPL